MWTDNLTMSDFYFRKSRNNSRKFSDSKKSDANCFESFSYKATPPPKKKGVGRKYGVDSVFSPTQFDYLEGNWKRV